MKERESLRAWPDAGDTRAEAGLWGGVDQGEQGRAGGGADLTKLQYSRANRAPHSDSDKKQLHA